MRILKYQKLKNNEYKIITDEIEFKLYGDLIIKHELLLKKNISKNDLENILKENRMLCAYFQSLKYINIKLRTVKEIENYLKKKDFSNEEIKYAVSRLKEEHNLDNKMYIQAYIHDALTLNIVGEKKIKQDLIKLGFTDKEVMQYLEQVDVQIYQEKIKKYIDKKSKSNKTSIQEFKRKMQQDLIHKGFLKEYIDDYLNSITIEENKEELKKLIQKLNLKYSKKYDKNTCYYKIKMYLYQKGYSTVEETMNEVLN